MGESGVSEPEDAPPQALISLDASMRLCRRCEEAGYLSEARPVVADGGRKGGMMLIGQAPGIVEFDTRVPFGGRAGRELFRWLASIGVKEVEFRDRVYMGAVTRCFPGRSSSGSGDRKPSGAEIALCRPWLEGVLNILEPAVLLLVGQLAIECYLPRRRLEDIVGKCFDQGGARLIPLPHPSGASRWLNDPEHRELLRQALAHVQTYWEL